MRKKYTIMVQQEVEIQFPYFFKYNFGNDTVYGKINDTDVCTIEVSNQLVVGSPIWDYQFSTKKITEDEIQSYLGFNNKSDKFEWCEQLSNFNKYFSEKFVNLNQQ